MNDKGNTQGTRLGGAMLTVGFIAALVLMVFLIDGFSERREARLSAPESVQLDGGGEVVRLRQRAGGHYIASGEINGHPVLFMLDTGATSVAIPAQVARDAGVRGGRSVTLNTANGLSEGRLATLGRVRLGSISLDDVEGVIAPGMEGDAVLLGMSFLRQVDFSQQGDYLVLRARQPTR